MDEKIRKAYEKEYGGPVVEDTQNDIRWAMQDGFESGYRAALDALPSVDEIAEALDKATVPCDDEDRAFVLGRNYSIAKKIDALIRGKE